MDADKFLTELKFQVEKVRTQYQRFLLGLDALLIYEIRGSDNRMPTGTLRFKGLIQREVMFAETHVISDALELLKYVEESVSELGRRRFSSDATQSAADEFSALVRDAVRDRLSEQIMQDAYRAQQAFQRARLELLRLLQRGFTRVQAQGRVAHGVMEQDRKYFMLDRIGRKRSSADHVEVEVNHNAFTLFNELMCALLMAGGESEGLLYRALNDQDKIELTDYPAHRDVELHPRSQTLLLPV